MPISLMEAIALVTLILAAGATVATIVGVTNSRIRNSIFFGVGLGLAFVAGLLAWPFIWQRGEANLRQNPRARSLQQNQQNVSPSPLPAR